MAAHPKCWHICVPTLLTVSTPTASQTYSCPGGGSLTYLLTYLPTYLPTHLLTDLLMAQVAALPTLEWYIRVAFTLSTGPCTPLSKLHLSHPRTAAARSDIYERYNVGSSPTLAWWSVRLPRGGRISAGSSAYASSTHVTHHRGSHTHTPCNMCILPCTIHAYAHMHAFIHG